MNAQIKYKFTNLIFNKLNIRSFFVVQHKSKFDKIS